MSLNPREYDIRELRGLNRAMAGRSSERGRRRSSSGLESTQYRELLLLQNEVSDLQKPYLEAVPGTIESEQLVLDWLAFLVEIGGYKRACSAIRHYRSLGWLTEPVENRLHDYLTGMPDAVQRDTREFDQADHMLSLVYIGRLGSQ